MNMISSRISAEAEFTKTLAKQSRHSYSVAASSMEEHEKRFRLLEYATKTNVEDSLATTRV